MFIVGEDADVTIAAGTLKDSGVRFFGVGKKNHQIHG
jgi:hypothetical protein